MDGIIGENLALRSKVLSKGKCIKNSYMCNIYFVLLKYKLLISCISVASLHDKIS